MLALAEHLAAARAALRAVGPAPAMQVLPRQDGAAAVALLVTVGRAAGDLVVPLGAGRNFVGRGGGTLRPYGTWPRPEPVEQAQWWIRCEGDAAHAEDAYSTNQSVLVPAALAARLRPDALRLSQVATLPGAVALLHPAVEPRARPGVQQADLGEGDLLVTCYAAFVFGWCR